MPERKQARNALVGCTVVGLAVVAFTAIFLHLDSTSRSTVEGTLTIDGESFAPIYCRSGKIEDDGPRNVPRFHGVDLLISHGEDRSVRVLEDPSSGTAVLVMAPHHVPRHLDTSNCDRFEVELEETGEAIMSVWGMRGSIDLECEGVRGRVSFENCFSGR